MKLSPDGKEITITPTDLFVGALTLRIHKDLPLKVSAKKTMQGLVLTISEDTVDVK